MNLTWAKTTEHTILTGMESSKWLVGRSSRQVHSLKYFIDASIGQDLLESTLLTCSLILSFLVWALRTNGSFYFPSALV